MINMCRYQWRLVDIAVLFFCHWLLTRVWLCVCELSVYPCSLLASSDGRHSVCARASSACFYCATRIMSQGEHVLMLLYIDIGLIEGCVCAVCLWYLHSFFCQSCDWLLHLFYNSVSYFDFVARQVTVHGYPSIGWQFPGKGNASTGNVSIQDDRRQNYQCPISDIYTCINP